MEVNEELDLEVVIKRLKAENTLLRQELQLLRSGAAAGTSSGRPTGSNEGDAEGGGSGSGAEQRLALTEAEQHVLRRQVATFVQDPSPHAVLNVEVSMPFIQAAFDMLKGMVCARAAEASPATPAQQSGSGASSLGSGGAGAAAEAAGAAELRTLRQLVQQQEQQIGVLTGVLRKQGLPAPGSHPLASRHASSGSSDGSPAGSRAGVPLGAQAAGRQSSTASNDPTSALTEAVLSGAQQQSLLPLAQPAWPRGLAGASGQPELAAHAALQPAVPRLQPPVPASDEVLADKNKAVRSSKETMPAWQSGCALLACPPLCPPGMTSRMRSAGPAQRPVPSLLATCPRSSSTFAAQAPLTALWQSTRLCCGSGTKRPACWAPRCAGHRRQPPLDGTRFFSLSCIPPNHKP